MELQYECVDSSEARYVSLLVHPLFLLSLLTHMLRLQGVHRLPLPSPLSFLFVPAPAPVEPPTESLKRYRIWPTGDQGLEIQIRRGRGKEEERPVKVPIWVCDLG